MRNKAIYYFLADINKSLFLQIVLLALIGACAAGALPRYIAPQYRYPYYDERARAGLERNAAILRSENEVNENGYRYAFDTENGKLHFSFSLEFHERYN